MSVTSLIIGLLLLAAFLFGAAAGGIAERLIQCASTAECLSKLSDKIGSCSKDVWNLQQRIDRLINAFEETKEPQSPSERNMHTTQPQSSNNTLDG